MASDNAERLSRTAEVHGFKITPEELDKEIMKGEPSFTKSNEFNGPRYKMEAELFFRKDNNGYYHWNNFKATMTHATDEEKNRSNVFYINKGNGFTFREAANLMDGHEIKKELINAKDDSKYQAHISLDFDRIDVYENFEQKRYTKGWGFDEKAVLSKYNLLEVRHADTLDDVLRSINKGNPTLVHFMEKDTATDKEKKVPLYVNSDAANRNFIFRSPEGERLERKTYLKPPTEDKSTDKSEKEGKGKKKTEKKDKPEKPEKTDGPKKGAGGRGK